MDMGSPFGQRGTEHSQGVLHVRPLMLCDSSKAASGHYVTVISQGDTFFSFVSINHSLFFSLKKLLYLLIAYVFIRMCVCAYI